MRKDLQRLAGIIGSLPRELTIALVVTIVATVVPLVALLTHKGHVWVVALAALVAFLVGLVGRTTLGGASNGDGLTSRISELESRTTDLGEDETRPSTCVMPSGNCATNAFRRRVEGDHTRGACWESRRARPAGPRS